MLSVCIMCPDGYVKANNDVVDQDLVVSAEFQRPQVSACSTLEKRPCPDCLHEY
jgi:hypothetical protein